MNDDDIYDFLWDVNVINKINMMHNPTQIYKNT